MIMLCVCVRAYIYVLCEGVCVRFANAIVESTAKAIFSRGPSVRCPSINSLCASVRA